ncbi:hypothetical protein B7494_g2080 [Chlorociboria aeruginascens]|nr:hypothetical protein B7494_g2080 [Chlorociboria aeruginascens]
MTSLLVSLALLSAALAGTPTSCSSTQLSCHNTTVVTNLCCFNAPGGQLLQTQFWDTSPSTGPSNSWTIHGLWPDNCDGSYQENCDSSRDYTGISSLLTAAGKTDVLSYMNTYWKNDPDDGSDEELWEHEWATHGTCINTLDPSCYTGYTKGEEAVDFFSTVVNLFQTLDTYTWLANADIVPSSKATYTSAQIQAALKAGFGYAVTIECSSGALDQVYYSFDVRGSIQTGTFVPTSPVGQSGSCSSSGIKYLPKSGAAVSTTRTQSSTRTTTSGTSSPTGTFSGSGYLNAITSGSQDGCLISAGTWYTTGTCATYTASPSGSGFTLKSSKGSCGISNSEFTCASGVSATIFTWKYNFLCLLCTNRDYASDCIYKFEGFPKSSIDALKTLRPI